MCVCEHKSLFISCCFRNYFCVIKYDFNRLIKTAYFLVEIKTLQFQLKASI